jgi:hypothetical protein
MEGIMRVKFEKVIDGLNRYIDSEIYGKLNDFQEMVARIVVGRVNADSNNIKTTLMTNGFAKTLCLVDSDGMVDIDRLLHDIRHEIERKGSLEVDIPLIGKIKFISSDVDVLYDMIVRE